MYHWISELKDVHKGSDIFIIGSGATLNYFDKSFFENKITIGINHICKLIHVKYTLNREFHTELGFNQNADIYDQCKTIFITLEHAGQNNEWNHLFETEREYYVCPCDGRSAFIRPENIGSEKIINAHNSVTTAMHLAFYLGAKNIFLCGIDNGMIDEESNIVGYYSEKILAEQSESAPAGVSNEQWVKGVYSHPYLEYDIQMTRNELLKRGCNVVSVNPFVTLNLEGRTYSKTPIDPKDMWAGEKVCKHPVWDVEK